MIVLSHDIYCFSSSVMHDANCNPPDHTSSQTGLARSMPPSRKSQTALVVNRAKGGKDCLSRSLNTCSAAITCVCFRRSLTAKPLTFRQHATNPVILQSNTSTQLFLTKSVSYIIVEASYSRYLSKISTR